MEKAVVETIEFFESFDTPVRAWEIQKWLIKKKATLSQIEKTLNTLLKKKKIKEFNGYYSRKTKLLEPEVLESREVRQTSLSRIRVLAHFLKILPNIDFLGVCTFGKEVEIIIHFKTGKFLLNKLTTLAAVKSCKNLLVLPEKSDVNLYVRFVRENENIYSNNSPIDYAYIVLSTEIFYISKEFSHTFETIKEKALMCFPNWISQGFTPITLSGLHLKNYLFQLLRFSLLTLKRQKRIF